MKVSLRDIEVGDLNNTGIMILSKFARELHEHNGTVLKLQDPDVLLKMSMYANTVDNPELRMLYERLKLELRIQLNDAVPTRAGVGSLVSQPDLRARVQRRIEGKRLHGSQLDS